LYNYTKATLQITILTEMVSIYFFCSNYLHLPQQHTSAERELRYWAKMQWNMWFMHTLIYLLIFMVVSTWKSQFI